MTDQRIKKLRVKIRESRTRLMYTNPFFALLLMYVRFIAVPDMKKMSTNGRCIFFEPGFVDKLYPDELDFILCHQIMHIICGDIWREEDLTGDNYHFACDAHVNRLLEKVGFKEERYAHLGSIFRNVPGCPQDAAKMTVDQLFAMLPYSLYVFDERTRSRLLVDSDSYWSRKDDLGQSGILILDIPEKEDSFRWEDPSDEKPEENNKKSVPALIGVGRLKQEWQGRAAAAAKSLRGSNSKTGAGDVPEYILRAVRELHEPALDWRAILDSFLQEQICDYSFSPPDRRFADTSFFLPDFNEKEYAARNILFMADTSASIEDEDIETVFSEIKGAIEQFNGKLFGKLGFFDATVKPPVPFENVQDLQGIIPRGGGGTDFRPIFDYVRYEEQGELPACIVIFTDGDGPYPDKSAAMGIPVLWLLTANGRRIPWGKNVQIQAKKEE